MFYITPHQHAFVWLSAFFTERRVSPVAAHSRFSRTSQVSSESCIVKYHSARSKQRISTQDTTCLHALCACIAADNFAKNAGRFLQLLAEDDEG
jgi:hypothetical protein